MIRHARLVASRPQDMLISMLTEKGRVEAIEKEAEALANRIGRGIAPIREKIREKMANAGQRM